MKQLRLRWLVALAINLPLPFIALPITGSDWIQQQPGGPAAQAMMTAIVVGGAALIAGLFARSQCYKAHWRGDVVEPAGYLQGNTRFFFAACVAGLALLAISLIARYPAPTFAAAPVLIGLLVFSFPNGRPMRPAPPRIGIDGDLS